jgi:hypothetical protein
MSAGYLQELESWKKELKGGPSKDPSFLSVGFLIDKCSSECKMQQQWLVSLFTTETEIAKCNMSCSSLVLVCGKGVCWEVSLVKL